MTRRFFVSPEKIHLDEPEIEGQDVRHIRTVLRLGPGDDVVVFDGTGAEYAAHIVSLDNRKVRIALSERLVSVAESPIEITLAQGYLKDKKMDELVRRTTELGVARWIPFIARRSVPHPDAKRHQARLERWRKISLEAVKQCRRSRPMAIEQTLSFEQALVQSHACDLKLFFWEERGQGLMKCTKSRKSPRSVFVMVGPEGGFESGEHDAARQHGFQIVNLGPRILRAETAALAATALTQYLFGDLGQNMLDNS